MVLSPQQLQTLKTWLVANASQMSEHEAAGALNTPAAPAYKVYRPSVPMAEIMLNGFDWTRVDNLSAGKARIWQWMIDADPVNKSIDPSKPNIRAGINAVWVVTAADLAVRAAVYLHCQRDATVAEQLLATGGAGTACDANGDGPATLGHPSPITPQDVVDALNS
jgi:S-formylglutathione hydrolase FrmB